MTAVPPLPSMQALRILDAVVRFKSFSAAARELGLTHGAVSRQMRQLEVLAGASLFRRRGPVMEPSEAALAIAARAAHALRAIGELFASGRQGGSSRSRLRLATTASFARFWLAPRLEDLGSVHGLEISAVETSAEPVRLDQGKVHVAVRYGRGAWPNVQSRRLGAERTFPVASPKLARRLGVWNSRAIERAPLIANAFISWSAWMEAAGLPASTSLNIALETSDSNFSLDAAVAGMGIALARARLVEPMLMRGELVRISPISVDDGYAYYLAWPAGTRRMPAIESLSRWLTSEFDAQSQVLNI